MMRPRPIDNSMTQIVTRGGSFQISSHLKQALQLEKQSRFAGARAVNQVSHSEKSNRTACLSRPSVDSETGVVRDNRRL